MPGGGGSLPSTKMLGGAASPNADCGKDESASSLSAGVLVPDGGPVPGADIEPDVDGLGLGSVDWLRDPGILPLMDLNDLVDSRVSDLLNEGRDDNEGPSPDCLLSPLSLEVWLPILKTVGID
jgi:hypothetical protein